MREWKKQVFAASVIGLFAVCAATATADELPGADELADMEAPQYDGDAAVAPQDGEELGDPEQELTAAEEESPGDDEGEDAQEPSDPDGWETPLRDRIAPSISREGAMGFHSFASAISPGPLNFQVALLGDATAGTNFIRYNDEQQTLAGKVVVNASILDYFGAHFGIEARNSVNTFGRPQAMLAQGDTVFGATGRYPVADGIWLGGDLNVFIPSAFGGVGVSVPSASVRPRAMASFDVDEIMGAQADLYVPLVAHINFSYLIDNSESLVPEGTELDRIERFAYGISAYDIFEMAVGLEFPLPYVTPFLGWSLGIPVNPTGDVCASRRALDCVEDVGAAAFPHRLSLGAKGEPVDNLGLHFGMDIGLTPEHAEGLPATLPYQFHFGVSWNIDPLATRQIVKEEVEVEVEPVRGVLIGRVVDEVTGQPVEGARIRYVGRDVTAQVSDGEAGFFQSYPFEPGETIELELEHPRYELARATWDVEEGSEELEISMEPLPRLAVVRGQVYFAGAAAGEEDEAADAEEPDGAVDRQPAAYATIIVRDGQGGIVEAEADPDGAFEVEAEAGGVSVAARFDGYLTAGRFVEVNPEEEVAVELELKPSEEPLAELGETQIGLEKNVQFEEGGANILEESQPLLDHVAAIILDAPAVAGLEIQGHTDDDGEKEELVELSEARARAVVEALVERGVSPERLEAKGYGSARPLMPNTSSRNRSMNRRIEFHVLD